MSNWLLLIGIPIGLWQIAKRQRLVRGLYAMRDASLRAANALDELRRATDAIGAAVAA